MYLKLSLLMALPWPRHRTLRQCDPDPSPDPRRETLRSGLDSTTALQLVESLRALASGGRAIITTIHQPSSRLYQLLDKLMLLCDGHVMYYGKVCYLSDDNLGFPLLWMSLTHSPKMTKVYTSYCVFAADRCASLLLTDVVLCMCSQHDCAHSPYTVAAFSGGSRHVHTREHKIH